MRWIVLAGLLLCTYVIYLLKPILTPFLVGAGLAYLFDPLVTRLTRYRINRTIGTTLVFIVATLILTIAILALVPVLLDQSVKLVKAFPQFIDSIQHAVIPPLNKHLGINIDLNSIREILMTHAKEVGSFVAKGAGAVFGTGSTVILAATNILLIPVISFYLLRDWPNLMQRLHGLLPRAQEPTLTRLAVESNEMLGSFLRGQLAVMLANGISYSVGLSIVGLETGLVVGFTAGLLSFIPYLGTIVGIGMALIAMYIQADSFMPLLWVLVVFGIGQMLESVLWQPRFVGEQIGLHPVAVIFAVMAGGQLFGFFGVLLALPVSAILIVLGRYAVKRYRDSRFYLDVQGIAGNGKGNGDNKAKGGEQDNLLPDSDAS